MTVKVMGFFLMVPWVGLQCVIVAFTGHTDLLYNLIVLDYVANIAQKTESAECAHFQDQTCLFRPFRPHQRPSNGVNDSQ